MSDITRRNVLRTGLALSATPLLAHVDTLLAQSPATLAPRERLLLDFGWKFTFGNGADPAKDLGFGKSQGDFAKSGDFHFATEKFDDSKWRSLNLPHDWAIELPFVDDGSLDGHGYKPLGRAYPETSVGWYRRQFDLPAAAANKRISIEFEGAFRDALVFLNGYFIGRNDNGYAPFAFDLSDFLVFGAKNTLVVRMDASFGDGWFYEGAGIYRHVWLTKTDAVHLGRWESYIRPEVTGTSANLSLGTVVQNDAATPTNCRVTWKILDAAKKIVATGESGPQPIAGRSSATFTASAKMASPALWSPETPTLYSAVVSVESAGKTLDAEEIPFGVRTVRFDVDKGFFLNGKSVKIKGTCNHQDHAGVGAALPDALQYFRVGVLKSMGGNAVRTSHNMPTPAWVEACDRMGMMMMCETRMESSNDEGLAQLETMIKRFRNSPSIILWSMGNEEGNLQRQPLGERVMATMVARSHALDPTRLCTAAVNNNYGTGISKSLDVEGFNYNLKEIEPYHKSHPTQPLVGTETASAVSTRGIYSTDKLRNWVESYDTQHPPWAELAEEWWTFYATRDYLPGGFAWTGFDYRGEPTPYQWPSINSQFGIVDMCGFPKDTFFYYRAWWQSEPVLHLFPHWNWEGREGEMIRVWVHSNLDEVELFLNGKSLGAQNMKPLSHLEWKVQYAPGTLEARGKRSGAVVQTAKRETTGKTASLKLTPERASINADGEDLAIIRVEAFDAQGRAVPTADETVSFKVSGAGAFLGVGNGDPNCQQSDIQPKRSLFNGLAQLIVQATKSPGEIVIEATAGAGITAAKLTVPARSAMIRPTQT
jgi:beta-galactosidase